MTRRAIGNQWTAACAPVLPIAVGTLTLRIYIWILQSTPVFLDVSQGIIAEYIGNGVINRHMTLGYSPVRVKDQVRFIDAARTFVGPIQRAAIQE